MTLKLISATLLFVLFLTSCNSVKKTTDSTYPDSHTSQNSLDWQDTYSGVTPCASCPGIETELTLTSELNYILTTKYIDHEGVDTVKGNFAWDGNVIKLDGIKDGERPSMYKVEEGKIRQLDLKGKEINGSLASNYVLTKNGNEAVEDKRWKLIELFGKPITGNAQTHYIIFHSKDGKLEAKANCNVILNNYKIKNQYQLNITPGIATLIACPDNLEQELLKALAQADNLSVSEKNLSLNKARMAPLTRFELVKEQDYSWIYGKTFIQEGSENIRPELGGAAFLRFESKEIIDLKTGDIVARMKATFDGDKITLTNKTVPRKRTFTIINNEYLQDEHGLKWKTK